jgi:hypothetical protein
MHFDSVYAYNEELNTCLMLSGFQLTNLKTMNVTTYQATLSDLLSVGVPSRGCSSLVRGWPSADTRNPTTRQAVAPPALVSIASFVGLR